MPRPSNYKHNEAARAKMRAAQAQRRLKEEERRIQAKQKVYEVVPVEPILQLLKEIDSRSRITFAKVHNIQVEMAELNLKLKGVLAALTELLTHPNEQSNIDAILRDFLFNKNKPK